MNPREVLFELKDVSKSFKGQTVLVHASLTLSIGEVVVVLGGNGAGKTTLIDIMSGHVSPDTGVLSIRDGETLTPIADSKAPWQAITRWEMASRLGRLGVKRIWQDARLFPTLTLWENLTIGDCPSKLDSLRDLFFHPFKARHDAAARRSEAESQLQKLGFANRRNAFGNALSLGQEKRITLRRVTQGKKLLLLVDEPMAGMDMDGRAMVLDVIRDFISGGRSCVVVTEHASHVSSLIGIASRFVELRDGTICPLALAPETTKAADPLDRYVPEAELSDLLREDTLLPGGARLIKLRPRHAAANRVALKVTDLNVSRNGKPVFGSDPNGTSRGVSFEISYGECGVLVAPNGWGKTTLFDALAGIVPIERGSIMIGEVEIRQLPVWKRRRYGLRILRARDYLFDSLTSDETLRLIQRERPTTNRHSSMKPVRLLSGGERRRLSLSTLKGSTDSVVLADEPFSGLDRQGIAEAWTQLGPRPDVASIFSIPDSNLGGSPL